MTREEAIKILEQRFDSSCRNNLFQNVEKLDYENALWMAISALRSATREQVEKVCRGEWLNFYNDFSTAECSKCGELFEVSPDETPKEEFFKAFKEFYHFCPSCGAPMTDDANCTARVNFRRDSRRTIMKIEEVIKQLESILDHTHSMAASPDADDTWKEDIDALEFALTALRSMPEVGEPLSLEQLKQMDGKPVWCEDVERWAIVSVSDAGKWKDVPFALFEKNGGRFEWNVEDRELSLYSYPPAQQRWIPVSERLPDRRRRVLCRLSYPDIEDIIVENQYYGNGMWMEESEAVTHWMPLPEPPEEG